MAERTEVKLKGGQTLHQLHNGEGRTYGHFEVLKDGRARQWARVWHDEFKPIATPVWPGPISIIRALLRGEI